MSRSTSSIAWDHASSCCASPQTRRELRQKIGDRLLEWSLGSERVEQLLAEFVRELGLRLHPDLFLLIVALRGQASVAVAAHRVTGERAVIGLRTRTRPRLSVQPAQLVERPGGSPRSPRSIQRRMTMGVTPIVAAAARMLRAASASAPFTFGRIRPLGAAEIAGA